MRSGKINIEVEFPIIVKIENEFYVAQNISEFTECKRSYIPILRKMKEIVIDSKGYCYNRTAITFLKYINFFNGFSLRYAGFGACYVEKEMQGIGSISAEELKKIGNEILKSNRKSFENGGINIANSTNRFNDLHDREDILRYMFYFAAIGRYENPENNDPDWRHKKGLIRK